MFACFKPFFSEHRDYRWELDGGGYQVHVSAGMTAHARMGQQPMQDSGVGQRDDGVVKAGDDQLIGAPTGCHGVMPPGSATGDGSILSTPPVTVIVAENNPDTPRVHGEHRSDDSLGYRSGLTRCPIPPSHRHQSAISTQHQVAGASMKCWKSRADFEPRGGMCTRPNASKRTVVVSRRCGVRSGC